MGSMCVIVSNFVTFVKPLPRRSFFDFSRWRLAAVRHLGFVMRLLGPPMKCSWWSLWLCTIWLESALWFWRYVIFNVMRVWLENAYSVHAPFCFLEVKLAENGNVLQFCTSRNATTWDWRHMNPTAYIQIGSLGFQLGIRAKFWVTKKEN